jgi:putative membrane protein insertion efficiency factor
MNIAKIGDTFVELRVPPEIGPAALRALVGNTPRDYEIDQQPIPESPRWRRHVVRLIRAYRTRIGHRLGSRCVYEPSCSHYAELVYRRFGFLRASLLTIRRLKRCRPDLGGLDLPPSE